MRKINDDEIVLCMKGRGCCPVVKRLPDDVFEITDDFGGRVILSKDEFNILLPKAIEELSSSIHRDG